MSSSLWTNRKIITFVVEREEKKYYHYKNYHYTDSITVDIVGVGGLGGGGGVGVLTNILGI